MSSGAGHAFPCRAVAVLLALASAHPIWAQALPAGASAENSAIAVRITSPLGRTTNPTRVRIVAQIKQAGEGRLQGARFFVDGAQVGEVTDGPPYAVEWTDENPYVRREIIVQAWDASGNVGEDKVVLKPVEIAEKTEVTSVLVEAAVYDKKGRFITGLDARDFVLRENAVPQKLDLVSLEAIPATFALLVDSSQSMSRRLDFVREAAGRVVSYLRPKDRVIVAPFSTSLGPITGPTDDRDTVSGAIAAIQAQGRTAIQDGLIEVARLLAGLPGRRAVILVTDGYDERSRATIADAIAAAKKAEVTVYVVGIGGVAGISLLGADRLRTITDATGGRAFFPPRPEDLGEIYDVLAADAQNRYLVTYTPANQRRDGQWRKIELGITVAGRVVQSRDGYLAPKPAPIRPSLEFSVMDLQSRYLDVSRDDLVVLEDGVEQQIETFQEAVSPITIALALDASGSMKKSAQSVIDAARSFVGALRPADSLLVLVFADKSVVAHTPSKERTRSLEAIASYKAEGGTALYDALWDSLQQLKSVQGRAAVVVLTDGRDEDFAGTKPGSEHSWGEVVNLLRETGVTAFTVGLGTKIDQVRLTELARLSGGQPYFPVDVGMLPGEYAKILENLRRRYIVSYTSTNPAHDGSWRPVEIRSRRKDVVISARSGYFAPER